VTLGACGLGLAGFRFTHQRQSWPLVALEFAEDAVLLDLILYGVSLASVDPAAERGEQEPAREVVDHLAESWSFKWPM
jgi:hypothetical protein